MYLYIIKSCIKNVWPSTPILFKFITKKLTYMIREKVEAPNLNYQLDL